VPSDQFRQFLKKIADRQQPMKPLRYRESLGMHMIGALSVGLGIAAVLSFGDILRGAENINQSMSVWLDPPDPSRMPVIPPTDAAFARYSRIALVGQFLGIAEVWRSRKMKGTLSLLSVIGISFCTAALAPFHGFIIFWAVAFWPGRCCWRFPKSRTIKEWWSVSTRGNRSFPTS
jgi:hypothetical protein